MKFIVAIAISIALIIYGAVTAVLSDGFFTNLLGACSRREVARPSAAFPSF